MKLLHPDGIELCIAFADAVLAFEPDKDLVKYLRTLKNVTIHAPWMGIQYGDEYSKKVLKKIEELCRVLWANDVIIHGWWTDDYELFREYDFNVLVENEDYKFPLGNTPDKLGKILTENPDIGFNFDFAHALTIWPQATREFIDRFQSRIVRVHMSNLPMIERIKDHNFLHRDASDETLKLLQYFKERVNAPLTLECVAGTEAEIDLIQKEIEFIRAF